MATPVISMQRTPGGFQCASCDRSFKSRFSCLRHIRVVHEGQRRFKCSSCSKEFGCKDQLQAHEHSKHLNDKPFVCRIGCGKSFASLSARHYHHKILHFDMKFKCEFFDCTKEFCTLEHLRNHIEKDHSAFFLMLEEQIKSKQLIIDNLQKEIEGIHRLKERSFGFVPNSLAEDSPSEEET